MSPHGTNTPGVVLKRVGEKPRVCLQCQNLHLVISPFYLFKPVVSERLSIEESIIIKFKIIMEKTIKKYQKWSNKNTREYLHIIAAKYNLQTKRHCITPNYFIDIYLRSRTPEKIFYEKHVCL